MTKEEQIQEMARIIYEIRESTEEEAKLAAGDLYALGYRKVSKPKVLSDEETAEVLANVYQGYALTPLYEASRPGNRAARQAQLNAAWKEIWGEE